MVTMVLIAGLMVLAVGSVVYIIPYTNKLFGLIWTDPREENRRKIIKRIKELTIDGDVPEETAVLMAAKEQNIDEENLMEVLGVMSPSEVRGLFTGKRGMIQAFTSALDNALKSGTGRKRR